MRKLMAYIITLVVLAALYIGAMLLIFRFYPGLPLYTVIILVASLVILFALVSMPLRRPIQSFVDRFFYRNKRTTDKK